MIAQCKGKDIDKVAASKLLQDGWYSSIKYDGNYVQIEKRGNIIKFWTSGGKQFYIEHIAEELINRNPNVDFTIECEYIADTDGKLGSRGRCTTTTYRTNFAKGISNNCIPGMDIFKVFDCIYYEEEVGQSMTNYNTAFRVRRALLQQLNLGTHLELVEVYPKNDLETIKKGVHLLTNAGYEGFFLVHETHTYEPSKRVNTAIKLKLRPTADLLCIDVEAGEGKYAEMIGSLVLQDSKGRIVRVGSGLDDADRSMSADWFLGKVIEIEYEQIIQNGTYQQPVFIQIRKDKDINDID